MLRCKYLIEYACYKALGIEEPEILVYTFKNEDQKNKYEQSLLFDFGVLKYKLLSCEVINNGS